MPAINTNNQITKFDYSKKALREDVSIKQKNLKEELAFNSSERDISSRGNNSIAKEPPKLDKKSIIGVQELTSEELDPKKVFRLNYNYGNMLTGIFYNTNPGWEHDTRCCKLPTLEKVEFFFNVCVALVENRFECVFGRDEKKPSLEITGRKAVFSILESDGDLKPYFIIELCKSEKDNNNLYLNSGFCSDKGHKKYVELRSIQLQEFEQLFEDFLLEENEINVPEKETLIVNSSYFLDKYLKQTNLANKFVVDRLIDKKLQSILKFV